MSCATAAPRDDGRSLAGDLDLAAEPQGHRAADAAVRVVQPAQGGRRSGRPLGRAALALLPDRFPISQPSHRAIWRGRLPVGNRIQDWPITYDDLEPYYDAVDYDIGVSGKAGNIKGKQIDGGNVFEGPRSREYPLPPLATSTRRRANSPRRRRISATTPSRSRPAILSEAYKDLAGNTRGSCYLLRLLHPLRLRGRRRKQLDRRRTFPPRWRPASTRSGPIATSSDRMSMLTARPPASPTSTRRDASRSNQPTSSSSRPSR